MVGPTVGVGAPPFVVSNAMAIASPLPKKRRPICAWLARAMPRELFDRSRRCVEFTAPAHRKTLFPCTVPLAPPMM
jgi:hypothetical protein